MNLLKNTIWRIYKFFDKRILLVNYEITFKKFATLVDIKGDKSFSLIFYSISMQKYKIHFMLINTFIVISFIYKIIWWWFNFCSINLSNQMKLFMNIFLSLLLFIKMYH